MLGVGNARDIAEGDDMAKKKDEVVQDEALKSDDAVQEPKIEEVSGDGADDTAEDVAGTEAAVTEAPTTAHSAPDANEDAKAVAAAMAEPESGVPTVYPLGIHELRGAIRFLAAQLASASEYEEFRKTFPRLFE